jgi:hypothetical protein
LGFELGIAVLSRSGMFSSSVKRLLLSAAILFRLPAPVGAQQPAASTGQAALVIDLKSALERARTNSLQLQSASVGVELAQRDRALAKNAFYPAASHFNQYLYTQANGTPSGGSSPAVAGEDPSDFFTARTAGRSGGVIVTV